MQDLVSRSQVMDKPRSRLLDTGDPPAAQTFRGVTTGDYNTAVGFA